MEVDQELVYRETGVIVVINDRERKIQNHSTDKHSFPLLINRMIVLDLQVAKNTEKAISRSLGGCLKIACIVQQTVGNKKYLI